MAQLPRYQFALQTLQLLQSTWTTILNPFLANPSNNSSILTGVVLQSGTNVIDHLLGQKMQGWEIADLGAPVTIYRPASAPFNAITLTLVSSGLAIVNIRVY